MVSKLDVVVDGGRSARCRKLVAQDVHDLVGQSAMLVDHCLDPELIVLHIVFLLDVLPGNATAMFMVTPSLAALSQIWVRPPPRALFKACLAKTFSSS